MLDKGGPLGPLCLVHQALTFFIYFLCEGLIHDRRNFLYLRQRDGSFSSKEDDVLSIMFDRIEAKTSSTIATYI